MNQNQRKAIEQAFEEHNLEDQLHYMSDDISEAFSRAMEIYKNEEEDIDFENPDQAKFYQNVSKRQLYLIVKSLLEPLGNWLKRAKLSQSMIVVADSLQAFKKEG